MAPINPDRWRELQPLLDDALELPAHERAVWLDSVRASHPELVADLAALLAAEDAAERQRFLADPPTVTLTGLKLGAYTLETPLGSGGMGSVWLARRTDGRFEGRAAVKLMNLALLSPTGQERFRREGTMLARLTHPGIARLLDAGVSPTSQPYLVIEHVDGERIDRFADAHALGRDERIRLVLQVLDAVGHAHANLIVHRDIKPSNILVTGDGTVKLLDFGIAKLLEDQADGDRTGLTADGRVLTPDYAAPEQIRGEPVTTATDVYAAGVLLYLLLSGRHPTGTTSSSAADIVHAVLDVEPTRLGFGDLDTVIAKALRKTPAERYQTAAALADDLRRFLRDEPVSARPDSLAYRARKFVRRNRASVAAAVAVSAVLLGATAFSLRQMGIAREQRDAAVRSARRAMAMSELQRVLASDSRDPDGRPLTPPDRIALAERVLVRRFHADPWLVAEMMAELSDHFAVTGDRASQRRMLDRVREVARGARLPAQMAFADCLRANSWWVDDQIDSARAEVDEAKTAIAQPDARAEPFVQAVCLEAEGRVLQATGSADSGVALLERASALTKQEVMARRQRIDASLAEMLRLAGRTRDALPIERRHLTELEAIGLGEADEFPNAVSFFERSLANLGELATVDSALRSLIRTREAVHGAGRAASQLAFLYGQNKLRLGALDSAELWLERASRDTTEDAGAMSVWLPFALVQLRLDQHRPDEARARAAQLAGGARSRRATSAMLRARLLRVDGDVSGASRLLEGELATLYRESPKGQMLFTLPLVTAGEWRLAAGDAGGADSLARLARSAALVDSLASTRSAFVGRAELLLSRARRVLGDAPGARDAAQRAGMALANGYGPANAWTLAARALRDSMPD